MKNKDLLKKEKANFERQKEQAKYFREELKITSEEKALEYFTKWNKTQIIQEGIMKGTVASRMKMFAILSYAIEQERDLNTLSCQNTKHGWDLYWKAKDLNLH